MDSLRSCTTSGIPQGSNLGPLLFICFINDLPSALTCGSLLYADDNKMYSTINNLADALTLQENLNRLSSWCILNKLALNVSKCKVVSYSYKKSPLLFNYHIDNLILKRENTIKDLGIYFDERLNFNYCYHRPPGAVELSSPSSGPVSRFVDRCRFNAGVANAARRRRWPFRTPAGLPGPSGSLLSKGEEH
jgi:hypothetical protein